MVEHLTSMHEVPYSNLSGWGIKVRLASVKEDSYCPRDRTTIDNFQILFSFLLTNIVLTHLVMVEGQETEAHRAQACLNST